MATREAVDDSVALPSTSLQRVDTESPARTTALAMDAQDHNGETPLHIAVKVALGNVNWKEPLIQEMDSEGASSLSDLLRNESARLVDGYPVRELACAQRLHNAHGLMPIHIAAARGSASVCEALIRAGAPVNARSIRREPLVSGHFCCPARWGRRDEHGEITEVAVADKTALHFAVGLLRDQHEMMEKPCEEVEQQDLDLVRLLLRSGANVNAADNYGQTPFQLALVAGMHQVVGLLADAGADLTASCRSFGQKNTALHLATLLKDVRMVRLLTAHGACVDAVGRDGWTPLCLAARQGSADVAKALLEAGASLFIPSGHCKKTPLEIATLNAKRNKLLAKSAVFELLQHEVVNAVLDVAYARARSLGSASQSQ